MLRSGSTGSGQMPSPRDNLVKSQGSEQDNSPITLKHFNALIEMMQNITSSIERIENRQSDLFSQLASCNAALADHTEILTQHESSLKAFRFEVDTMQHQHTSLSSRVSDLSTEMKKIHQELIPDRSNGADTSFDVSEVLDRVTKSHNLIALNVPERGDGSEDVTVVSDMVDFICGSASRYLVNTVRLRSTDENRPRWLKMTFSNPETVRNLLRNKSRLHASQKYRKVIIRDDKTRNQLDELNKLREELRRRQSLGEDRITIKYVKGSPKIVTLAETSSNIRSKN